MRLRQFGRVAIAATMVTSFAACGDDDDDDDTPLEDIESTVESVVDDIGATIESVVEDATDGS